MIKHLLFKQETCFLMFLAYSGFSWRESLICRQFVFHPGRQAISKSSKSWTCSLNQSQALAGKPTEHNAGPHYAKHQSKCRFNSSVHPGISFHSEPFQPTASLSCLSFPLSILPCPFCPLPLLFLMSVNPGSTLWSLGSSDGGWISQPPP